MLLWLSWKIATAGRAKSAERERPIGFLGAVAFQWVNPKGWLIAAGSVSFLQPDIAPVLQAAFFGLTFVVLGTPCMLLWLGFGAAMQRVLQHRPRAPRLQHRDGRAARGDRAATCS